MVKAGQAAVSLTDNENCSVAEEVSTGVAVKVERGYGVMPVKDYVRLPANTTGYGHSE